jgi:hypothetical protein
MAIKRGIKNMARYTIVQEKKRKTIFRIKVEKEEVG